jgi:hypothetical protein
MLDTTMRQQIISYIIIRHLLTCLTINTNITRLTLTGITVVVDTQ